MINQVVQQKYPKTSCPLTMNLPLCPRLLKFVGIVQIKLLGLEKSMVEVFTEVRLSWNFRGKITSFKCIQRQKKTNWQSAKVTFYWSHLLECMYKYLCRSMSHSALLWKFWPILYVIHQTSGQCYMSPMKVLDSAIGRILQCYSILSVYMKICC